MVGEGARRKEVFTHCNSPQLFNDRSPIFQRHDGQPFVRLDHFVAVHLHDTHQMAQGQRTHHVYVAGRGVAACQRRALKGGRRQRTQRGGALTTNAKFTHKSVRARMCDNFVLRISRVTWCGVVVLDYTLHTHAPTHSLAPIPTPLRG